MKVSEEAVAATNRLNRICRFMEWKPFSGLSPGTRIFVTADDIRCSDPGECRAGGRMKHRDGLTSAPMLIDR